MRKAEHLAGLTVGLMVNGKNQPAITLENGGELPGTFDESDDVVVGLTFTRKIATLTPEVGGPMGSSQGNSMRISEVTVRALDTLGLRINDQEVKFRRLGREKLDEDMLPVSGEYRMENLGWGRGEAQVTIESGQQTPFHVLSVIKKITVND